MVGSARSLWRFAGPLMATTMIGLLVLATGCPNGQVPNGEEPDPNSGVTGKYIGSERCSLCHEHVQFHWSHTLHARALESLRSIGQETNPNCLPCHTVGFGEEGGYVDEETTLVLNNVGCESCHGAARDHAMNANDSSLYPPVDISSEVCGRCHTGSHHPNFDEWEQSGHSGIDDHVAEEFVAGESLNSCGKCHSGDAFYRIILMNETVADDEYAGVAIESLNAIECAVCHNPHQQTGNAATPEDGRDFQLRYPEVANPTATNTVDAATNPTRFNLCGQCHHSRGREWTATSRGPHHSVQSNVYAGEMPVPEDTSPLVPSRVSVHSFAPEQCATCHLYRQDFQDEEAPAIAGHTFEVNTQSCATAGCHPSQAQANAALTTLQSEMQTRLDTVLALLGDPADWEYSATGGPDSAGQAQLSDAVKQARFIVKYVEGDGSLGMHNPDYVRALLQYAEAVLTAEQNQ